MSRIGRQPILIPSQVKVNQQGSQLAFEGPKGKMDLTMPSELSVTLQDGRVQIQRASDVKSVKALHGLYRALAANIVKGITEGFQRDLEISGVGYRAELKGKQVVIHAGYSHPVALTVPQGLTVEVPKPTQLVIKGVDKQLVGQFAANIRHVAPPEPYKGKGIKYAGEVIRRKAGKAATGAKGAGGGGGG